MDDTSRGEALKRRRLALGIKSLREFAEGTGIDRGALAKAEQGVASDGTYERAEAWLTRQEVENGHDDEPAAGGTEVTLRGVYGIDELIYKSPSQDPDIVAEAVSKLLEQLKNRE